jgi:hypothetical protein
VTCNVYRSPPTTLRELTEAAGFESDFPELERRRYLESKGMSQRQVESVLRDQRRAWDDRQDSIVEHDGGPNFLCGDLIVPVCKCGIASDYLCDYPMGRGKTCDLSLCPNCSRHVGEELDLCEIHFAEFTKKSGSSRINPWPPKRTP